jgi:hypothetical protein
MNESIIEYYRRRLRERKQNKKRMFLRWSNGRKIIRSQVVE